MFDGAKELSTAPLPNVYVNYMILCNNDASTQGQPRRQESTLLTRPRRLVHSWVETGELLKEREAEDPPRNLDIRIEHEDWLQNLIQEVWQNREIQAGLRT